MHKIDLPFTIKNFFEEDELLYLRNKINELFNSREKINIEDLSWEKIYTNYSGVQIDKFCGRAQLSLSENDNDLIPDSIKNKMLSKAKEIDPDAELRYFSIVKYSKEYGIPQLAPHCDHPEKETFLFDIQIDGNIDWPLVVEGDEYIIKNNDILVIDVQNQSHWRKPLKFNDDSFIYMLFAMFKNNNLNILELDEQVKKSQKYNSKYNKDFENLFQIKQFDWKAVRGK